MTLRFPFVVASFLVGSLPLSAATVLYMNDFSGTGGNLAFTTETTDAEWALNGGAYRNTYSKSNSTASTAALSVGGVVGNSFTMESQFTVTQAGNFNVNGATLGFGFFASSPTFSTTSNSFYLADFQYGNSTSNTANVGLLRILSLGDDSDFSAVNASADGDIGTSNLAVSVGTTYTLRLIGTYEGETLNMSFGLWDAAGTSQIGTSATATDLTPLTGTNFGYRNRIGQGGGTSIIDYDNYSITASVSAVPEPSAFAFLGGVVVLGAASVRRRRR